MYNKANYQKNREKIILSVKIYQQNHREERKAYLKKYKAEHKIERNRNQRLYLKNPVNKLIQFYRQRIWETLKYNHKAHTLGLIGCSMKVWRSHLEKQFKVGMSWANYGKWHVDHIRPLASFDFKKNPKLQFIAFNYKNTQPLWAVENLKKSNTI